MLRGDRQLRGVVFTLGIVNEVPGFSILNFSVRYSVAFPCFCILRIPVHQELDAGQAGLRVPAGEVGPVLHAVDGILLRQGVGEGAVFHQGVLGVVAAIAEGADMIRLIRRIHPLDAVRLVWIFRILFAQHQQLIGMVAGFLLCIGGENVCTLRRFIPGAKVLTVQGILSRLVVVAVGGLGGALHGVVVDLVAVSVKGCHVFQGQRPGVVVSVSLPVAAAAHVLDLTLVGGSPACVSRFIAERIVHRHVHHPVDVQVQVGTQAALVGVVVHPHLGPGDVLGRVPPVGDVQRLDVQRVLRVAHVILVFPFEFRVRVVAPQVVEFRILLLHIRGSDLHGRLS